jgi:hypothetical protein
MSTRSDELLDSAKPRIGLWTSPMLEIDVAGGPGDLLARAVRSPVGIRLRAVAGGTVIRCVFSGEGGEQLQPLLDVPVGEEAIAYAPLGRSAQLPRQ